MSNPYAIYKANYINNLPSGVTYNSDIARFFYNGKSFFTPQAVESYRIYLNKFSTGPFDPGITGGITQEYTDGNGDRWRSHTATGGDTLVVPAGVSLTNVDYLMYAGGGAGGAGNFFGGGGGGAGEVIKQVAGESNNIGPTLDLTSGTFVVSGGAGGLGGHPDGGIIRTGAESDGEDITLTLPDSSTIVLAGGGGGGNGYDGFAGRPGGSGGGAGRVFDGGTSTATIGFGNRGGNSADWTSPGGGALSRGSDQKTPGEPVAVGQPLVSIIANGTAQEYCSGGGRSSGQVWQSGNSSGGDGTKQSFPQTDATDGARGGGGGSGYQRRIHGSGGDGALIIRYRIPTP